MTTTTTAAARVSAAAAAMRGSREPERGGQRFRRDRARGGTTLRASTERASVTSCGGESSAAGIGGNGGWMAGATRACAISACAAACAAGVVFGTPLIAEARRTEGAREESARTELIAETAEAEAALQAEGATDQMILDEAWELVFDNFLPARKSESDGFDRAAWEAIRAEHDTNPPKTREQAYDMIREMLGTLGDRFTRFIEPDQFTSMLKYDITGVGLNISEDSDDPEKIKVLGLVLDSSAMKAGVVQDDVIVAVNGASVKGLSAFQVSSLIQEANGKKVDLTISRKDVDAPMTLSLERDGGYSAPSSPVSMRLEGGHVGYIRLREFNSLAERDIAQAIKDLRKQGADSYILDLRDNPGGLVQAGVEIARLFLPPDSTIAYTEGRVVAGGVKRDTDVSATKTVRNGSNSELPTKLKAITSSTSAPLVDTEVPLVVFVNGRSASASEILTGALKDNCRATVVGSKTYGKGLIQSVYELSDLSGMVLTVGKYVTPGLVDIDQTGISPNFPMFPGFDAAKAEIGACKVPPRY